MRFLVDEEDVFDEALNQFAAVHADSSLRIVFLPVIIVVCT
jgi:hypothetical protein